MAFLSVAPFYKPVIVPFWYCLFVLLDVTGTVLPHNMMTEALMGCLITMLVGWFGVMATVSLPFQVGYGYVWGVTFRLVLVYILLGDGYKVIG